MRPLVMIAFNEFGDTTVEEEILKKVGAKIEFTKSILTAEAQEIAKKADAIAFTTEPIPREAIETFSSCKILSRYGTGLDNVDIQAATDHGIWVTNVPDAFVEEVSTHAISLLLALNRHLIPLVEYSRQNRWENTGRKISRLRGQTLGLLGLGFIGKATAKKAKGIGLEVIAYDPYTDGEAFSELGVEQVDFEEMLKRSDYISLHTPATDETQQIINTQSIKLMKPTAYLINTSRGTLIDEDALLQAVQSGMISGAALDVRANEPPEPNDLLMKEERIIITPHLGWCSLEAGNNLRERASQAIVDVLQGQRPANPANDPLKGQ